MIKSLILGSNKKVSLDKIAKPLLRNEVTVKIFYSPINPADIGFMWDLYGRFRHKNYPISLGFEGSGIIENSNDKSKIGKRICFSVNCEKEKYN